MTVENPTGDAGASISERLESYLAAQDSPQPTEQSEQPKVERQALPDQETPEETEVESTESDAPDEGDESQIGLEDLAKYLGVDASALDVDEDGTVKVKTKIDGKEGAAKFVDLVKSYQLQGHVDAKAREAAESQKQLAERVQQFEQYAQTETQRLNQLASIAHQELMQDAATINWNELATNDPAEYVRQQHVFQQRQARVNQLAQAAAQQNGQWQQAQQIRYQQFLQSEAQRLPSLIPEWSDEKVRETEKRELAGWLSNKGVSKQVVDSLADAGLVAALRKAMVAEKGESQKAVTEKKVRTAPKLVKPGQSVDSKQRASESLRDLKQSIRNSGGKRGIAEYLMASGKV